MSEQLLELQLHPRETKQARDVARLELDKDVDVALVVEVLTED